MDLFDSEVRDAYRAYARPSSPCLTPEDFEAFYGNELPRDRMDHVRAHLASCTTCLELARDYSLFRAAEQTTEEKRSGVAFAPLFQVAAGVVLVIALGVAWTAYQNPGGSTTRGGESALAPRLVSATGTTLEWEEVSAAVHYDVELQDPRFNVVWRQSGVQGTRTELPADVLKTLPPGPYGWRVFAVTPDGTRTPSAFASLEIRQ